MDRIELQSALRGPMARQEYLCMRKDSATNQCIELRGDAIWHVDQCRSRVDGLYNHGQINSSCDTLLATDERRRYLSGRYRLS